MASFLGNNQSVENYSTVAVPQSLQGNDSPMAMRGKVRQVSIPNANGDQRANGKLTFVLPNNNVSISRRSMFIKTRVQVAFPDGTVPPVGNTTNTGVFFQGPGPTSIAGGTFNNYNITGGGLLSLPTFGGGQQLGNAYSLIQRSTVYSGSKPIDMIDYVCDLMSGLILPHNTSRDWLESDGGILLSIISQQNRSTSTATTGGFIYWDVCIPVPHSCLNSERDFPAYLVSDSNPLSLEVDLTSFNRAFAYYAGMSPAPIQDYTLTRCSLCYESIELPREFIEAQRLATKKIPFVIPQLSYINYQMPMSALINYNVNLKLSSLRAAYILPFNNTRYIQNNLGTAGSAFGYQRNTGDIALPSLTGDIAGTNAELICDGELINKVRLDNIPMTFAALKQAINGSITNYYTPSIANVISYRYAYYAIGINATLFSDGSTIMGGTPVDQAQIILTNYILSSTTGAYLANVIFAYDSLLIFKNGKIETKR